MSTLPTPESHYISLDAAVEMTTRYRSNRDSLLKPEYAGQDLLANAETFNKEAFKTFWDDTTCAGIRVYYGMGEDLKVHAIFVGVTEDNEDILPPLGDTNTFADGAVILEDGKRCPPYCDPASPLNQ